MLTEDEAKTLARAAADEMLHEIAAYYGPAVAERETIRLMCNIAATTSVRVAIAMVAMGYR